MLTSRFVLNRASAAALAATSIARAPPTRSSRRKRRGGATAGKKAASSASSSSSPLASTVPAETSTAADLDEVERLLAATTTAMNAAPSPSSPVKPSSPLTRSDGASRPVGGSGSSDRDREGQLSLDSASALHFKAVHDATALHDTAAAAAGRGYSTATTTRDGPTHVQLELIERRRSKPSLAEVEFDVGVSERLVPELPRLPALHEVNYGDAVVREVDRSTYVASQRALAARPAEAASTVVIDGETCVELSLDGDLTASEFAAFDAEAAATTAASGEDGTVAQEKAATVDAVPAQADTRMDADGLQRIDDDDDAVAVPITFGTARPWFVPASGVVRLEPLPPADCARLLRFVLYLRQQTENDLASSLRRSLLHTEKVSEAAAARQATQQQQQQGSEAEDPQSSARGDRRPVPALLTLADVVRYLDTAPPPVIGFSESMPAAAAAAAVAASPRHSASAHTKPLSDLPPSHVSPPHALSDFRSPTSPAFVFHLYLENVSSQNAIGHLATLFGIPQRCFQSHSAVSKMSCSTVICAVAENRVRREHLLLLNTLRHPGFVLRVSNIQEVDPQRYMRLKGDKTSSNEEDEETECHDAKDKDEEEEESMQSVSHHLFGELARWQPLYQTEVLLRRVSGDASAHISTRQQLEHRLRAVQTLGAICFCATREPSLARAATDVLHGFFKSALLNALQRRKAPVPLQRFLKRPNVATAQHAHHVSTDSTVRHVLKTFVQTNGDWHETVVRTPYVWRRRWINALRGLVWNTMASQRMRKMGREVVLGDVVLRPEFRQDVHQRGVLTVKAEHVMVVTTEAEAAGAELEDVCLPFLRGRYPEHLFAPESTNHPIMTKTNMLALLRSMHAPQLLLGLTDDVRLVLDVRAESSPMLFRRLLVKPLGMEFVILEDKPPMRSLHYDAARLLTNDRWRAAETVGGRSREEGRKGGVEGPAMHSSAAVSSSADPMSDTAAAAAAAAVSSSPSPTPTVSSPATIRDPTHDGRSTGIGGLSSLIPPSEVLERTTLGSRLRSGVLADEFFAIPSPADYVVLGHAHRHLHGSLVPAAPHTDTAEVGDRVYTIYIRAVVDYSLSGLANMLREYFLLSGIETESESALQHKVHRMRRELDSETPLLTAPVYCTTCFNRDHDAQEQCAEYQFKVHRRAVRRDVVAAALESGPDAKPESPSAVEGTTLSGDGSLALSTAAVDGPAESVCDASPGTHTLRMRLHLRRRNDEQRWGVHLTKSLHFVGMEDVKLMKEGVVWNARSGGGGGGGHLSMSMPDAGQSRPWPAEWITAPSFPPLSHENNDMAADAGVSTTQNGKETPALAEEKSDTTAESSFLRFMAAALVGHGDEKQQGKEKKEKELAAPPATVMDLMLQSPVLSLPLDPAALQLRKKERTTDQTSNAHSTPSTVVSYTGSDVLKACKWTLKLVNATPVVTQRDVAAALLTQATKKRDVWLTFECRVDTAATATAAATTPAATSIAHVGDGNALGHTPLPLDLPTTHAANAIPQSTAALSPKKRHAVEVALRGALARTSPATQRWLMDMPHRLTLVLVKYRTHLHKHRSWGLQLDGTDMTLVNFARLMVQYMYVTESTERRRLLEHACVASVAPSAPFPRNDPLMTSRLFDEVLPSLEPLLNDTYRVVRLDNTPVRHKAEAARAMAAFQVKVDEELAALRNGEYSSSGSSSSDRRVNSISNADMSEFYLTLTLERKGSSYRVCASAAAAGAGSDRTAATSESDEAAMTAVDALKQEKKETVDRHTSTGDVSRSDVLHGNATKAPKTADTVPAATASADAAAIHVSPALLSGLATPQCPVHALTPPQLTRSTVTVAINRLVLTDQTREKWGLRLQQGTRRLKAIQQNRHFSFHVFAAKQSQGTRIADTLRLVSTSRRTPALDGRTDSAFASEAAAEPSSSVAAHVMTRSFYLYFIERVNQRPVRAHAELRRELRTAALPQPQANVSPAREGGGGAAAIHTLPPESLTLSLRQFPLLRITATVRRGGVDEGSALGPVGLQVDKRMRLLSVVAESPMARALTEAVGPLCSARRLIHHRERRSGSGGDDDDVERDRGSGRTGDHGATAASARWDVVVLPELRQLLAALDTACRRSPAPAATHRGDEGGANASQHQWAYDLDEDAAEAPSSSLSATSTVSASTHADPSNATNTNEAEKNAAEAAALRALADASSRTLQELSKCSMVDGVHILQTSLLYEYAVSRLTSTATTAAGGSDSAGSASDTGDDKGLAKLQEDLASVFDQVRWEVVYAAQSNRPLRTPADLAAAFAPGVAEETISIQQFVED